VTVVAIVWVGRVHSLDAQPGKPVALDG
jgi:hypothetical protein